MIGKLKFYGLLVTFEIKLWKAVGRIWRLLIITWAPHDFMSNLFLPLNAKSILTDCFANQGWFCGGCDCEDLCIWYVTPCSLVGMYQH